MEPDPADTSGAQPGEPSNDDERRTEALARYDAHPSISILLLAVMAFLFIVATYQFVSDRLDNGGARTSVQWRSSQRFPEQRTPQRRVPKVGMPAFSQDGNKVGAVESITAAPDGSVSAINVLVGSYLGLGAKLVAIPASKFNTIDEAVHITLTADDIATLPDQGP
jgi:PRC-barrel domain protein